MLAEEWNATFTLTDISNDPYEQTKSEETRKARWLADKHLWFVLHLFPGLLFRL